MNRRVVAIFAVFLLAAPLSGSIAEGDSNFDNYNDFEFFLSTQSKEVPYQEPISWDELTPWWETTTMDKWTLNRINVQYYDPDSSLNLLSDSSAISRIILPIICIFILALLFWRRQKVN